MANTTGEARQRRGVILTIDAQPQLVQRRMAAQAHDPEGLPVIDGRESSIEELSAEIAEVLSENRQVVVFSTSKVVTEAAYGAEGSLPSRMKSQLGLDADDALLTEFYADETELEGARA